MSRRQVVLTASPLVAGGAGFPIPDFVTSGAGSAVFKRPYQLPSDVTVAQLLIANRSAYGLALSACVSNIALYGDRGAAPLGKWLAQSVPADGSVLNLGDVPIVPAGDGTVLVVYSLPATFDISEGLYNFHGTYANATTTVDPLPADSGNSPVSVFQIKLAYESRKRPFVIFGDSISVNSTNAPDPASNGGFLAAAWNLIAFAHDFAVDIEGVNGGQMHGLVNTLVSPYWGPPVTVAGKDVVCALGTNDIQLGLGSMQTDFAALVAGWQAGGAKRIWAQTVPPTLAFIGDNATRVAWNAWLLANYPANRICDASAALADPMDPTQLLPAYSSDGTHLTAAGQAALAAAWEATLGI